MSPTKWMRQVREISNPSMSLILKDKFKLGIRLIKVGPTWRK